MKVSIQFFGTLAAVAAVTVTFPAIAADADNGKQLAERWCQSCHAISANQPMAVTEAPPFATIARKPGFDESKVAAFLLEPHPKMPPLGLSREAASDLAAFIASQK
jgi:mono/diheme cytochrome c family protein